MNEGTPSPAVKDTLSTSIGNINIVFGLGPIDKQNEQFPIQDYYFALQSPASQTMTDLCATLAVEIPEDLTSLGMIGHTILAGVAEASQRHFDQEESPISVHLSPNYLNPAEKESLFFQAQMPNGSTLMGAVRILSDNQDAPMVGLPVYVQVKGKDEAIFDFRILTDPDEIDRWQKAIVGRTRQLLRAFHTVPTPSV